MRRACHRTAVSPLGPPSLLSHSSRDLPATPPRTCSRAFFELHFLSDATLGTLCPDCSKRYSTPYRRSVAEASLLFCPLNPVPQVCFGTFLFPAWIHRRHTTTPPAVLGRSRSGSSVSPRKAPSSLNSTGEFILRLACVTLLRSCQTVDTHFLAEFPCIRQDTR